MMRTLYIAATGMITQQDNIDVTAHNIANVNTTGFKRYRAQFATLLSQNVRTPGSIGPQGTTLPVGIQFGLGARTVATQMMMGQGSILQTGNPTDFAIEGAGFFQVQLDNGSIAYTRDGSFKIDANGQMVTSDGFLLQPNITIPSNASDIIVQQNGTVSVRLAGQTDISDVGQINLVRFANPAGLQSMGRNLYLRTPASGDPLEGQAGQGDFADTTLTQGFLESSNSQIVEEMINLITAQRAFEANSKGIQTADEMLGQANQLKR